MSKTGKAASAAAFEAAGHHLGVEEWPGAKHNPLVLEMFAQAGHGWVKDDETPWCAAFVGAVLGECGIAGSGSLAARSYLKWGEPVANGDAVPGDVVVFWRGSPSAATGHVAFFVRWDGANVIVRGGNQGNRVSDTHYSVNRLLAVRRYGGGSATNGKPALRFGDQGVAVAELQTDLAALGYFSGRVDGDFGPLTRAALLAFQADQGLATDAVAGSATLAALAKAEPRPRRNITQAEIDAESGTAAAALMTGRMGDVLGGVSLLSLGATVLENPDGAERAVGLAERAGAALSGNWPLVALVVAGLVAWVALRGISHATRARRLRDAQEHRSLAR